MSKPVQLTRAEIDAIVYECRQSGNDTTYDIVNAALARAGIAAPTEPSDDEIEAAALKHVATDWHRISHLIPNYRCTEQFARLKAFAEELAAGAAREGGDGAPEVGDVSADRAQQGEPVGDIDADPDDNADFCKWLEESGVDLGDKWVAWSAWCGAMNFRATKAAAPDAPKDHEIREAINQLRDIAVQFHATQQLRARIADIVLPLVKGAAPVPDTGIPTNEDQA